jgi:ATP-dependent phosphofructokinase / diphosphate-dependent phosphofructokinase
MKIAVLTGGGDVPGLNSAIKGLAKGALEHGWQAVGFRNGWMGLLALDADDPQSVAKWTVNLDANCIRTIDRFGGTFLHSSRTNPGNVKAKDVPASLNGSKDGTRKPGDAEVYDFTPHVLKNLKKLGIDVLFPIGGDDTLSYGERLYKEGFNTIGIPKTMDNDVHGTDYCLGFATCVSRSVQYIHQLRTAVGSHERFAVVECMGRNSGATALIPAYLASVDRALISEVPFDVEKLAGFLSDDKKRNPSGYAMVTVSEGAQMKCGGIIESGEADAYGHKKLGGIGQHTGDALKKITGEGIIYQNLGYLVRSGAPDPLDVMVTFNFANLAVELAAQKKFGNLVRLKDGVYGYAPMSILSEGKKTVEVDKFYDAANYRPKIASVLNMPMYLR